MRAPRGLHAKLIDVFKLFGLKLQQKNLKQFSIKADELFDCMTPIAAKRTNGPKPKTKTTS